MFTAQGAQLPFRTNSTAKVLQNFGIHKDFGVKKKKNAQIERFPSFFHSFIPSLLTNNLPCEGVGAVIAKDIHIPLTD